MNQQLSFDFPVIEHSTGTDLIPQRASDGYVNATAICKSCNKLFEDYMRLSQTKEFLNALSDDMGIPLTELIQKVKSGIPNIQGSWVHPQVAINLGLWASPQFAVLITKWVFDWMKGKHKNDSNLPFHIRRYLMNREKIPPTHFSMLDQMTLKLLAPLEQRGYSIPNNMMPDISLGRMFCDWLRKNGYEPDTFPTYTHVFNDGNRPPVQAKLYPNEIMTAFNFEVNNWITNKSIAYFKERDDKAIPVLENIILLLTK